MSLQDKFSRPMRDLRISVTDRCNLRCTYCMPKEVFGVDYPFLKREELLTFEEIARLARLFVQLGVTKIRVTGGEPLLRRELPTLVEKLATLPELQDLTLTTNGLLLPMRAKPLRAAGLRRITVSLDALDPEIFGRMNGLDTPVDAVLRGIDAAAEAGLAPIKINCVLQRGVNDGEILPLARHFRGTGHIVRFIEYMDVGNSNDWRMEEVVPAAEVLRTIHAEMPLEPLEPNYPGEVARRWRYRDGGGEIGVIASVTQPFCRGCTRARLSSEGLLYTCLFAASGVNLRDPLREGADDGELRSLIRSVWLQRRDRYSELRTAETSNLPKVEMSHIGG